MIQIDKHIVFKLPTKIRLVDYVIGVFPQLMTKNAVKKALKRNELLLNDQLATSGHWMVVGDELTLVDNENRIPKPFPLEVPVVFEDDYFLVVNKPSGLVVSGNIFRTLENAMVGKVQPSKQKDAFKWAKPVHRLDSATSGLIILSKTARFHREMAKLFEQRLVKKTYHAIVTGVLEEESGIFSAPIKEQVASTEFQVLNTVPSLRSENLSLLKLHPKTGRTHQIRIHCAEKNHPIVGDVLYGEEGNTLLHKGLFLASTGLEFTHPIEKTPVQVENPIPHKFESLLEREERRWKKFF